MRYRITVVGTDIRLTGHIEGIDKVREFAGALSQGMDPIDPLIAVSADPQLPDEKSST